MNANIQIALPLPTPAIPSTLPVHAIQLSRRQDLTPRPLSSHWVSHRMSPSPITSHIPQSTDVRSHFPP